MFNFSKNRKSIPESWCGLWIDVNGKQLIIKSSKNDFYIISLLDANEKPFEIDLIDGKTKQTLNLIGRFEKDTYGNPILQIEAGENGIGPTYDLYFLTYNKSGKLILAKNSDNLEFVIIKPNVGIGLYNDWEDDLGVPWAYPLEDFKFKNDLLKKC